MDVLNHDIQILRSQHICNKEKRGKESEQNTEGSQRLLDSVANLV